MGELLEQVFRYCPRCGAASPSHNDVPFRCTTCSFAFFFNPVCAVAGIVANDAGEVLRSRCAREPGKGKLGLPGGFVDAGEGAEEALIREIREEVNLRVARLEYFASFPNRYAYQGVSVSVTDLFFICRVGPLHELSMETSEVAGFEFAKLDERVLEEMAFPSNRRALLAYQTARGRRASG